MKWAGVLPWVFRPYYLECIATMHPEFKKHVLFIDNTKKNIGIMASHNMGIEYMKEMGADWLVIISAAIRFGSAGGLDFIKQIEDHQDYHVIHAASENVVGGKQADPSGGGINEVFGWHLTAFNKSVFEAIGDWDENFSNYGFDDLDLSIRIRKGIPNVKWNTYPCDVHDTTMSHSINLGKVESPSTPRMMYFKRKWNRETFDWQAEAWPHPFNDPAKPLSYWPEPNDPLSIQNNEFITLGGDRNP